MDHLLVLEARRDFLAPFCATGGSVEYFIGWFTGSNSGAVLDWRLLGRLAALQIDIALDVYGQNLTDHPPE